LEELFAAESSIKLSRNFLLRFTIECQNFMPHFTVESKNKNSIL
jgi:hypothetical protein